MLPQVGGSVFTVFPYNLTVSYQRILFRNMKADLHIEVFGETIDARADRKRKLNALKESDPDAYLEIPAIERR